MVEDERSPERTEVEVGIVEAMVDGADLEREDKGGWMMDDG